MSSIDLTALKAELKAQASQLSDKIRKYKCLVLIDQYIDALQAQANSAATEIQSYSIAGHSVSMFGQNNMSSTVNRLEAQINRLLYGNVVRLDMRKHGVNETNEET